MPHTTWTKHSFSAGELSPQICQSRKDMPVQAQGVEECNNFIPLRAGSLISRPCNVAYTDCKLPEDAGRIIPFNLTHGIYVLIVLSGGRLNIVALGDSSSPSLWTPKVHVTFSTPYSSMDIEEIEYAVFGSLMVLVHKDYPPHQLIYTRDGYKFSRMVFSPPPWLGDGIIDGGKEDALLSISKAPEGEKFKGLFSISADSALFKDTVIGRSIRLGCLPSGWRSETEYSENAFIVAGEKVYRSIQGGKSGKEWNLKEKSTYVKDGSVTWVVVASLSGESSGSSSRSKSSVGLSPYYVWGTIEALDRNKKTIYVRQRSKNSFLAGSSVVEWYLSAWTTEGEGYPSHITFYQNRLVLSGGKDDELSVYLSSFENFYDFSPDGEYGCYDSKKAISVAVTDYSVSEIKWMHPFGGGVLVGCDSSLWLLSINHTQGFAIDFRRISGSGVYSCSPVSVGDCLFFVSGAGRRIKALSGSTEQGFKFLEVTQLADHLFKHRIQQLVYQEEPYSIIWVILTPSGQPPHLLLGCRFSSEGDGDFAWHKHAISGGRLILSMASFPSVNHGETSIWMLVGASGDFYRAELERLGDFS
ncbi:MAG: hypothetical protein EPS19_05295 [Candidatus Liberibacter solanacearum]